MNAGLTGSNRLAARLVDLVRQRGLNVAFEPGLSDAELAQIEHGIGIRLPPDLAGLLRTTVPTSTGPPGGFPKWRSDPLELRRLVRRPLEELVWAIEHGGPGMWPARWGPRPAHPGDVAVVALARLAKVPRLIPLFGHRYIPASPHEEGNPVFSVVGYDVVCYGSNLENYIENEFARRPGSQLQLGTTKRIPLWSELAA